MKKKIIIGLIIVAGIAIAGGACSSKDEPSKVGSNSTKTEQKQPQKTEFKIGEAIKLKDMVLTVTDVKRSNGDDIEKPKSGNTFVIVNVDIKNTGKENISYNPLDFKLKNSQGNITDETFATINQDTQLQSGQLAPGGNVKGSLIFEAPTGDKGLDLLFQDNIFSNDAKITIHLNK